jgi:hypothetical protein
MDTGSRGCEVLVAGDVSYRSLPGATQAGREAVRNVHNVMELMAMDDECARIQSWHERRVGGGDGSGLAPAARKVSLGGATSKKEVATKRQAPTTRSINVEAKSP